MKYTGGAHGKKNFAGGQWITDKINNAIASLRETIFGKVVGGSGDCSQVRA